MAFAVGFAKQATFEVLRKIKGTKSVRRKESGSLKVTLFEASPYSLFHVKHQQTMAMHATVN